MCNDIDIPRRRVRIDERFNQVQVIDTTVSLIEKASSWYSSRELHQLRDNARDICRSGVKCLQDEIVDVRGLEGIVNTDLGITRKRMRLRALQSVMIAQSVAWEQIANGKKMDIETFISHVSAKESLDARKYAFMMGQADEHAMRQCVYPPAVVRQRRCSQVAAASA